jgi:hypothetical protein
MKKNRGLHISLKHVVFLKAHIKISHLPNFQNIWTLSWLVARVSKRGCETHKGTFSVKLVPFTLILTKSNNPKHTFWRIFHALHESNNETRKKNVFGFFFKEKIIVKIFPKKPILK